MKTKEYVFHNGRIQPNFVKDCIVHNYERTNKRTNSPYSIAFFRFLLSTTRSSGTSRTGKTKHKGSVVINGQTSVETRFREERMELFLKMLQHDLGKRMYVDGRSLGGRSRGTGTSVRRIRFCSLAYTLSVASPLLPSYPPVPPPSLPPPFPPFFIGSRVVAYASVDKSRLGPLWGPGSGYRLEPDIVAY